MLIALLCASGIPARYAYGVINVPIGKVTNWVGGVDNEDAAANLLGQGGIPNVVVNINGVSSHFKLEHAWVEAYVDFEPSRGIKNKYGDHWIAMDASFKQYAFSEGYELETQVPFDAQSLVDDIQSSATINEAEGWVQNVPQSAIELQLENYQNKLKTYIEQQNPDATIGEVLGLKEISIIPARPLSAGLPYDVLTRSQHFSEVPARLQHRFEYTLSTSNLGTEGTRLITINEPTAKLAGKNLSLSFSPETQADEDIIASYIPQPNPDTGEIDPAQLPDTLPGYLISLKAEFSINGDITHSASSGKMGEALYETMGLYSPSKGWFKTVNRPTAGEYRAIGLDLQGSSPEQAQQLQEQMEATKAVLESGNEAQLATLTKQQMVGDLLSATIYTYFALNNVQDDIAAQTANITTYRAPSFGVFRTNLNPVYWFGIARDVQFNGFVMDVDLSSHQTVANDNCRERWLAFNKAIGARGSAMEHLVPEQMFSTEDNLSHGISAVKALSLASAQGQKIYTIDQSNLEAALAAISLSSESEAEIRAGVEAGKVATAHASQIEYHGWVGEGYIVIDPDTGSGAYKIAGGDDGGFLGVSPGMAAFLQVVFFIALAALLTATIAAAFYYIIPILVANPVVLTRVLVTVSIANTSYGVYRAFEDCSDLHAIQYSIGTVFKEAAMSISEISTPIALWVGVIDYLLSPEAC